ncbi:MAG: exodeoxyribonuclease VII large subunit [Burkholderiaceae bacterium]|jgi:exodeoxyribonuclease VII large subunit|nr:exodeoxyribonuclease VII large subunit [Burkholderiaceae bacterium]
MNTGFFAIDPAAAPRVWAVGALVHAAADALEARFNPVAVRGEVSGFTRAASGHCYFALKDEAGQLRCAMFRRAAALLDFAPREGDQVELRARLTVYEPRGDLQLVVESMTRAGQGALFEQFLRLKARLQAEGLFDPARKRPLPAMPRGIGLVTSLGAAALYDVLAALTRRVPHIPVLLAPAAVQGAGAAAELCASLQKIYLSALHGPALQAGLPLSKGMPPVDVILLVRGGGSIEDLWAFNDEQLARTMAASPVPVITGIGHETDFCIADFVADLRAPTPTAAAELVSAPRQQWLAGLDALAERLARALGRRMDAEAQRIDWLASRLGRPSSAMTAERARIERRAERLRHALALRLERERARVQRAADRLPAAMARAHEATRQRLQHAAARLTALDPRRVLQRGYVWLQDAQGQPLTRAAQAQPGQTVAATLADGQLDMTVQSARLDQVS